MSLLQEFIDVHTKKGVDLDSFHQQHYNGFSIISFGQYGEPEIIYTISLVFYNNNNDVELFIRKKIDDSDVLSVFSQINTLNAGYRGMSFYLEEGIIVLKSYILANGDIKSVLGQLAGCINIATQEYPKFK